MFSQRMKNGATRGMFSLARSPLHFSIFYLPTLTNPVFNSVISSFFSYFWAPCSCQSCGESESCAYHSVTQLNSLTVEIYSITRFSLHWEISRILGGIGGFPIEFCFAHLGKFELNVHKLGRFLHQFMSIQAEFVQISLTRVDLLGQLEFQILFYEAPNPPI